MNILQKILETFLWKFFEKYFLKVSKNTKIFLLISILFITPIYCYVKYYEAVKYKLSYFFLYREKQISRNIDILLSSCHTRGVYIGYLAVNQDIIYFEILRGVLNSSTDLRPLDTLYLNSFYTMKMPLDPKSKEVLIANEKNHLISVIDYDFVQKHNMVYFIKLFDSLSVHGALDKVIDKIYLSPYIINGNIVFIVGLSLADSTILSNCNDGTLDYNEQSRILFDLKKSIVNTFK